MLSFCTSHIAENNLNGNILTNSPVTCPSLITRFQTIIRIFVKEVLCSLLYFIKRQTRAVIFIAKSLVYSQYSSTKRILILTVMNRKTIGEYMVVACAHSSLPPTH